MSNIESIFWLFIFIFTIAIWLTSFVSFFEIAYKFENGYDDKNERRDSILMAMLEAMVAALSLFVMKSLLK